MSRLAGRVAIVTGAGRGLGRAHARYLASQGAAVVVNDRGGDVHGRGDSRSPAEAVVEAIRADGGRAVASGHDVSNWEQAAELVQLAVDEFGELNVLVNNAGILRDRTLANMAESDWDDVLRVHLKGHAAPTRHAMAYWRGRSKAGRPGRRVGRAHHLDRRVRRQLRPGQLHRGQERRARSFPRGRARRSQDRGALQRGVTVGADPDHDDAARTTSPTTWPSGIRATR